MIIRHDVGKEITVYSAPERQLFTYDYCSKPKPFFHPVYTLAGSLLTNYEPTDHYWHRGLWFTIKFINDINFWEEYGEFGRQVTEEPPVISHSNDQHAEIRQRLQWIEPTGKSVFDEQRTIKVQLFSQNSYAIDFSTDLLAQKDLTLDRTPFTTWGGYGGLVVRGNRNWVESKIIFPNGDSNDRPTGIPANWASLSGKFDGGVDLSGGIALFDLPTNPRHPCPWYGATGAGHYLNAAFLFHEPMKLATGEHLKFGYRVLIYDGVLSVDETQSCYDAYVDEVTRSE